jgi:hypothetical protein
MALAVIGSQAIACKPPAAPPDAAFGQMPSADTTARALWMPWRVRAGIEASSDARERHFRDLRQLSFGAVDSGALWWQPGGRGLYVLRRDGDCHRVYRIHLSREDRNPSEPLGCIGGPAKGWRIASLTGRDDCQAGRDAVTAHCAAFMHGQRASRSPDRTRWIFRDGMAHDPARYVVRSLPQGRDLVLPALGTRIGSASWLADGRRILLSSNHDATPQAKGPRSLYVLALDAPSSFSGSPPTTRISFARGDHDHATLSPNGKHIAFVATATAASSQPHHIYVARWTAP